jgi:hypothetical protein
MSNHRQNAYAAFKQAIESVGETPCMSCPEVFFPEDFPDKVTREYATKVAKGLCAECPIKNACFIYAQETNERYGIWAGTLPGER